MGAQQPTDIIARAAARLAVVEVALGAFVHGLHIPLGGHVLSLNQGVFLTRVVRDLQHEPDVCKYPLYTSSLTAILKSLSPAGNKLGPMLSISAQGFLFTLGILLGGAGRVGVTVGMMLLSVWAFVQPLLTLYLFFGNGLIEAVHFYADKLQESLAIAPTQVLHIFLALVALKMVIAAVLGWIAFGLSDARFTQFEAQVARIRTPPRRHGLSPWRAVLRDLTQPMFWLSFVFMAIFLYFAESSWSRVIWLLLRPLAIAVVFFYFSHHPWLGQVVGRLRRYPRFDRFMVVFDKTAEMVAGASHGRS